MPKITSASRHYCPLKDSAGLASFHTSGNGRPRSPRCKYCRAELVTVSGLWGVFTWTGENRYPLASALSAHVSEPAAERARVKAYDAARAEYGYGAPETSLVVRWIPAAVLAA